MNKKGYDFIHAISEQWNRIKIQKPEYQWKDSIVQERIARLGREAKEFDIEISDSTNLESMAIATLRKDFLDVLS
jgi:hypothetical protein